MMPGIAIPLIPMYIRLAGVRVDPEGRAYIRRKLRSRLAKFGASVERVSVRMEDLNGPRGGVDQVCRIKVVISGHPSVVFENRGAALEAAVDGSSTGWSELCDGGCSGRACHPSRVGSVGRRPEMAGTNVARQ